MKSNWKIKLFIFIISGIYSIGLPYIIISIGYWNPNPAVWGITCRLITLFCSIIFWRIVYYNTLSNINRIIIKKKKIKNATSTDS